ncbi:MAG: hypothetical protein KF777_19880 [Planctomycetaceae bacterium]|nr:hypothetical protein [Planctomycetaceae bacterium]
MPRQATCRRDFLLGLLVSAAGTTGCGTVLHPERRGQSAGKLDWGIVALDAVGLFFFFVPGVIAFAVDFATGAIYLPADQCAQAGQPVDDRLVRFDLPRHELNDDSISACVSSATKQPIDLAAETHQRHRLSRLADFWTFHRRHSVG